ncbi:hypothetical protein PCCS19_18590 [Paenibacillus sp. CCS19]|uniref:ABC-three component system protein n=1 Tax=Paenibacillus sp. CCS19 TaxID=3158387 RepID=UPI00256300B9|nr:ABC-three component system protein [Paenibacillus cellulosilyticus]GMK38805.1 hypothetical protein PCCS19_18590 [Paenibacillus cellulosilyticus]
MKSNAPGQLLGFAIQFPRALYHLLRSSPQDCICVEVLGDVAIIKSNGEIEAEEDKSSINSNPLTDRSVDLWKTFSNWIEAISDGELIVEKTKFILFTNQSGRPSIVNKFHDAIDQPAITAAIKHTKSKLGKTKPDHEIWKYYDHVVNKNETLLKEIIKRFELQIGNESGMDEVRLELKKKHVFEGQIEFFIDNLNGWLLRVITDRIAKKINAIIRWEEFDHQFKVLFDRSRSRELIDFTMHYSKEDVKIKIQEQVDKRPIYLQQLEKINLPERKILNAISDYLRADVNIDKWIEDEIIDAELAEDFEGRLIRFWENQCDKISIIHQSKSESEQGQLILIECTSRQETIRELTPPESTIPGVYHSLADSPEIGIRIQSSILRTR